MRELYSKISFVSENNRWSNLWIAAVRVPVTFQVYPYVRVCLLICCLWTTDDRIVNFATILRGSPSPWYKSLIMNGLNLRTLIYMSGNLIRFRNTISYSCDGIKQTNCLLTTFNSVFCVLLNLEIVWVDVFLFFPVWHCIAYISSGSHHIST